MGNNRVCLYCVLGDSTLANSLDHVIAVDQIFECIDRSPTAYPPCALLLVVLSVCAVSFRLGQFAARRRGRTSRTLSSKVRYFLHASTPFYSHSRLCIYMRSLDCMLINHLVHLFLWLPFYFNDPDIDIAGFNGFHAAKFWLIMNFI